MLCNTLKSLASCKIYGSLVGCTAIIELFFTHNQVVNSILSEAVILVIILWCLILRQEGAGRHLLQLHTCTLLPGSAKNSSQQARVMPSHSNHG